MSFHARRVMRKSSVENVMFVPASVPPLPCADDAQVAAIADKSAPRGHRQIARILWYPSA